MSEEVTIYHKDGTVNFAILEKTGHELYHLRYIPGDKPEDKVSTVPIADVKIEHGYNYQDRIDYLDKIHDLLEWQCKRAAAEVEIHDRENKTVAAKVAKAMKAWDKENPAPDSQRETELQKGAKRGMEDRAAGNVRDLAEVITDGGVHHDQGMAPNPECPSCFRSDGSHASNCAIIDCTECGGPLGQHAENCSQAQKEQEEPCQSKYAGAPCTQNQGHEHFHTTNQGYEWSDSQADPEPQDADEDAAIEEVKDSPETKEEPQESELDEHAPPF